MKKILLILGILAILVFSGCTSPETTKQEENSPEWLKECPDGTKIDASEKCPDAPEGFSEAKEKQIFYELIELQDKYAEECTDESGLPMDCYPIKQQESYSEIAEKYDSTEETIREIVTRGVLNDWPMPPAK